MIKTFWRVGDILDYLDKNGLAENIIVIYTSDQGFHLVEHGWFDIFMLQGPTEALGSIFRWEK